MEKTNNIAQEIANEIKKLTSTYMYSIKIDHDRRPSIFDSKFGGMPYWDLSMDYPASAKGEKLVLLAQINLDKLDDATGKLPQNGMLQFFAGSRSSSPFGLDLNNQENQDQWRVVWHPEIDYGITPEKIHELDIPTSDDRSGENLSLNTPVMGEFAIELELCRTSMGLEDYRLQEIFDNIKGKYGLWSMDSIFDLDDDTNYLYDLFESNDKHHMLGYPYFTQADIRVYSDYERYDTLLLQIDSDGGSSSFDILWGDCGVGNFFINSEDLKNRDFSRILYNWDCC